MIFQDTWKEVLNGTKTQTRRLAGAVSDGTGTSAFEIRRFPKGKLSVQRYDPKTDKYRTRWQVGKTYAVQPGHGQKAVGRIRITHIHRQDLQELTPEDIWDEGLRLLDYVDVGPLDFGAPDEYDYFATLWDSFHTKPGTRWDDNPSVWVLTFELVQEADNGEITQS